MEAYVIEIVKVRNVYVPQIMLGHVVNGVRQLICLLFSNDDINYVSLSSFRFSLHCKYMLQWWYMSTNSSNDG